MVHITQNWGLYSNHNNICVIASVCQVPPSRPHRLCPTAINLQAESQISWTSLRIFAWFTHAFFTIIITNAFINQARKLAIFTLYGIEIGYPIIQMILLSLHLMDWYTCTFLAIFWNWIVWCNCNIIAKWDWMIKSKNLCQVAT